ncbi:MAG: glutamate-5-semialdehyde dehydrogenase [Nitrosomonadales bacterium]|nr:glutamate-5-semialdehyde dehydrogenase [Nitrosomonadales bacterium]|tara:strand:- start:5131 stop:6387 length:1257 start_codon:yes stop_codon:yes gene_type:complete
MDIKDYMFKIGDEARKASFFTSSATSEQKNNFLNNLGKRILNNVDKIININKKDLDQAAKNNFDAAFIDRLTLNKKNITAMAEGLLQIEKLEDPIGKISNERTMPSGIKVSQMRVSLGVIGMIYESRPNVTIDAAGLAIKSGNAIILRGGSESIYSNTFLGELITQSLKETGFPSSSVQIIITTDREAVNKLITMHEYVDVIIPRGGKSLIKKISDDAKIPVIKHLDGNCHIYVDEFADISEAVKIVDNAKTQRLGTCNTLESLVISSKIAKNFLPKIKKIFDSKKIEIRGCANTKKIIPSIELAKEEDFYKEYLGPIISCIITESFEGAIQHINKYSSKHTESIITKNQENSNKFIREIDSSSVMVNASTRFADGFEYGLGAEIGISTDKFHARGPVGLEGLTSLKYIVSGTGQIRQ